MNMKNNYLVEIFFVSFLFFSVVNGNLWEKDNHGILLLNVTDFQRATDEYKTVVTLIYIKDTPGTNKVVKLVNEVGDMLQRDPIDVVLAKLPLEYNNEIFAKYNLDGNFGLLALMDNGERFVEYTQEINDVESIVEFVRKKTKDPITEVNDRVKLKYIIESSPCVSVGFFPNFTSTEFEEYRSGADWFYECDHFFTKDKEIMKYFKVDKEIPTIKFYKECIHEVYDYPKQLPLDSSNILKYFLACMEPDVAEFGMRWLTKRVIKPPQFTLLLFIKKNDEKKESTINAMKKYARRYREEINMVYVDVDGKEDVTSFLYTFALTEKDIPCLRAIETSNRYGNNTRKYKPKKKAINDASLRQFIGEVYYRQLSPYLISDKLPEDWNKDPIVTVVGDSFKNLTEDPTKTVLIAIYNEEKRYVSFVQEQLNQLAINFKKMGRSDIIIGKSNYYSNEYYGWHPHRFPNLILFPKGENSFGIEFQMELKLEDVKLFIESDGKINKKEEEKEVNRETADSSREESATVENDDDEGEVEEVTVSFGQENNISAKIEL